MTRIDWRRVYPHPGHRWTMGVRPARLADFLAPDARTAAALAERSRWLTGDPDRYLAALPEAAPAVAEAAALAREHGADLDPTASPDALLHALGRAWEADIVWMRPGPDGRHRLVGGVVCFPSSWALRDKLGLPMDEVHAPVPGLNATLARPVEAFFSRMQAGDGWTRENLNFARDGQLNHHPSRPRRPLDRTATAGDVWLRFEHQFLQKLPASGTVLFLIRVDPVPLAAVLPDPVAADRLASVFESMSDEAAAYKGLADARETLAAICRGRAGESGPR